MRINRLRINRLLMLALATSLLIGCAKIKVVKVPEKSQTPADGVIYALPNTVVRVLVKVNKAERKGARYAKFAGIFAPGLKPVCKDEACTEEKKKTYSIQPGATFTTYGEPDPSNVFLVKFTGGRAIDQALSMTWNEAGLLSAASSTVTNRTIDVALAGARLVTGLGIKALGGQKVEDLPECKPKSDNDAWIIRTLTDRGGAMASTLIANYCAIEYQERANFVKATDEALLIEAIKDYLDNVAELVGVRDEILKGEKIVPDPVGLLTRIEDEIKQKLITLYIGSEETISWDGALDVRTVAAGTLIPVLRIDPENGICTANSEPPPDAKPFPAKFNLLKGDECTKARTIDLTLSYYPEREKQLFTKMTDITTGDRSFRYRIPAQVKAELHENKKVYGSGFFTVAQLGAVISLPASRQSKTLSYELAFIEATGGLKTFKLGTAGGLDAATIDALAGVGGSLLDARNAARKEKDELTVLTREYQLLKLRDDICTIQKKYGLPCTVQPE